MQVDDYLDSIKKICLRNFDIKENFDLYGEKIDLFCECKIVNDRTFITKKDVVDSYLNHEYFIIKKYENIDLNNLQNFCNILKDSERKLVKADYNHMSSFIVGVVVTDNSISRDVKNCAKKFRYTKMYKLSLNGWTDIGLLLVDVSKKEVISNRKGKKVLPVYEKVFELH